MNDKILLYYGFEEGEYGIYHAFEAVDPEAPGDDGGIADRLAELLDCKVGDDRFDYNSMLIQLPASLVSRIKDDAVKEFLGSGRKAERTADGIQRMGTAAFVEWNRVDNWCNRWAKVYFGNHAKAYAERDGDDLGINITGLMEQDREAFFNLFAKYDKEGDYEPETEFQTGENYAVLPTCITLAVLDEFAEEMKLRMIGNATALQSGVYFMENERQYDW